MSRVIVIGAGIAGLLAAHALRDRGHEVRVLDKGHRPGGRMASRRVGDARFDTGAQFVTAKSARFRALVDGWRDAGVAETWFHGAPDADRDAADGHPRFRGAPTMRSIPEHLARDLDVRTARVVSRVRPTATGWEVVSAPRDGGADAHAELADAVLCTSPVPQTLALLSGTDLAAPLRRELSSIAYDPTIAVLVVPRGRPRLGPRGALRLADGPVAFLTDNLAKGVSAAPAVTLHAAEATSRVRWDAADDDVAAEMLAAARDHLGGGAEVVAVHRWRYATPRHAPDPERPPARLDRAPHPIAFAGDAFAGGRVEGAARSGLAAADLLEDALG